MPAQERVEPGVRLGGGITDGPGVYRNRIPLLGGRNSVCDRLTALKKLNEHVGVSLDPFHTLSRDLGDSGVARLSNLAKITRNDQHEKAV